MWGRAEVAALALEFDAVLMGPDNLGQRTLSMVLGCSNKGLREGNLRTKASDGFDEIIGTSAPMQEVFGPAVCITGLTEEVGVDSEIVHALRRHNRTALLWGIPDPDPEPLPDGVTDPDSSANFIAPFILDPNNFNTLLAGGSNLWRSVNVKAGSPTWTKCSAACSGATC